MRKKRLSVDEELALLKLKLGDLIAIRSPRPGVDPVVGYFEMQHDSFSTQGDTYFSPVKDGTLAIYFRPDPRGISNSFWIKFHVIWLNGKYCNIHENLIEVINGG